MAKLKQSKLIKTLFSLIKDKSSLLKSTSLSLLHFRSATSSPHLVILLATTRSPSSPPSPCRLAAVLSHARSGPRPTASATISALVRRLRTTSSAHVALKCLIVIRHVIAHGSFILRDQLCSCDFPNLSGFRDGTDSDTWQLSNWVRFYSCYLETNLIARRKLGFFISSPNCPNNIENLSNCELMREIEVLVGLIEEISRAPDSGFDHKSGLIYEIEGLISEDYGSIQRLLQDRLGEFRDRVAELDRSELDELAELARRAEECRERMSEVFGNRKRNEAFWEFVMERQNELTRFRGKVTEPGSLDQVIGTAMPA